RYGTRLRGAGSPPNTVCPLPPPCHAAPCLDIRRHAPAPPRRVPWWIAPSCVVVANSARAPCAGSPAPPQLSGASWSSSAAAVGPLTPATPCLRPRAGAPCKEHDFIKPLFCDFGD